MSDADEQPHEKPAGISQNSQPPADAHPRGTCIGRYVVIDRLGEGGMAVVYKAYDPNLERTVALKLLSTGSRESQSNAETRDRLLREARALARLQHPNVVAIHDVGVFENRVFIALEHVEGVSLRQWLREKPRTQREILGAYIAAGEGLAAAHASGLVHRDFKCSLA